MDRLGLVLRNIYENPQVSQRGIAEQLDLSLGTVNSLIADCLQKGYLVEIPGTSLRKLTCRVTDAGLAYLDSFQVDGAVIFADQANPGVNGNIFQKGICSGSALSVPLNEFIPISLRKIGGETLIERQIRQLQDVGITDITIVTGYLKEKFEYLIDRCSVTLCYNPDYRHGGSLASFYYAREHIRGKRVCLLAGNLYFQTNPFHRYECGTCFSTVYKEGATADWCVAVNKKGRILSAVKGGKDSLILGGPVCLGRNNSELWVQVVEKHYSLPEWKGRNWEDLILNDLSKSEIYSAPHQKETIIRFDTNDEVKNFLKNEEDSVPPLARYRIAQTMKVPEAEIHMIRRFEPAKEAMTILYEYDGEKFLCRIPELTNSIPSTASSCQSQTEDAAAANISIPEERFVKESSVYSVIRPLHIAEVTLKFDAATGCRITRYYEGAQLINSSDPSSPVVVKSMGILRTLHDARLVVAHRCDPKMVILSREERCGDLARFLFADYEVVRDKLFRLLDKVALFPRPQTLCHMTPFRDRFLLIPGNEVRLVGWESGAMQDPLMDVAIFSQSNQYSEKNALFLLEIYLGRRPNQEECFAFFTYSAVQSLLGVLNLLIRSMHGEDPGDKTIQQYRLTKRYYQFIVREYFDDCTKD